MMAIDTLAYTKALEAAGVERQVAEAHAEALIHALSAEVATKSDLDALGARLKSDMAELKYDLSWRVFGMVLAVVGIADGILFALLRGR
jgi:hypothetical protein